MTEEEVELAIQKEIGVRHFDVARLTTLLNMYQVNPVSYLRWAAETLGPIKLLRKMEEEKNVAKYKAVLTEERRTLPQYIVNAGEVFSRLVDSDFDEDDALERLTDMCFPHAIYFMFASIGYDAGRFKKAAKAYIAKFPGVTEDLPEPLRSLGRSLLDDSTE